MSAPQLRLMAARETAFGPQVCLLFENYLRNRDVYSRTPAYDDSSFAALERMLPAAKAMFAEAVATPGLRIVFGTDAVTLAHGRNAEELVCRVRAGQAPMDAIVSATSSAARSASAIA